MKRKLRKLGEMSDHDALMISIQWKREEGLSGNDIDHCAV